MPDISTGGGGSIGGNAEAGGDFTGRDAAHNRTNVYVNPERRRQDDDDYDVVDDLRRAVFGDSRLNLAGLMHELRDIRKAVTDLVNDMRALERAGKAREDVIDRIKEEISELRYQIALLSEKVGDINAVNPTLMRFVLALIGLMVTLSTALEIWKLWP